MLIDALVILVALGLLLFFLVLQPAAKRRERTARLSALAAVLENGHLDKDSHILGTYAGYRLEAWAFKVGGAAASSITVDLDRLIPGDTFTIRLGGLRGRHYWRGGAHPSLNPFGSSADLQLTTRLPTGAGILGSVLSHVAGLSTEPDAELEQRLREAGMLEQMAQLQAHSRYLHLHFVPSSSELAERRMARLPGFGGLSPEVVEQRRSSGHLECLLQAPGGFGPPPQVFAEQLEVLGRIARINAEGNALLPETPY